MRCRAKGLLLGLMLLSSSHAMAQNPLLLPKQRATSFPYRLSDSKDFLWDIQYGGHIGSGTNYAYGNGAYLYIDGSSRSHSQGTLSQDGREVQLGPSQHQNHQGLRTYRRVRVYKQFPLCRWLEVLENISDQPVSVEVRVYSHMNYGIGAMKTTDADRDFGPKDWGFYTLPAHNQGNTPGVAQILCGPGGKLRPSVEINGTQINVRYRVSVPAKSTVAVCYFHSQGHQPARLEELLNGKLPYRKLMRDLPPKARKMILNFGAGNPLTSLELDRDPWNDVIQLAGPDRLLGKVLNDSFELEMFFGRLTLPAERVVGMVRLPGGARRQVRVLTRDGQIFAGDLLGPLRIEIPAAGAFSVDPWRFSQWSYRIDSDRPEDQPFRGPYLVLDSGSRLAFEPGGAQLRFRTRYGLVELDPGSLASILLRREDHGVHTAFLRDGGQLGGMLAESALEVTLRDSARIATIPVHLIHQFELATDTEEIPRPLELELNNGDVLLGDLAPTQFQLTNAYGTIPVPSGMIYHLSAAGKGSQVELRMWDGSSHQGILAPGGLSFRHPGGMNLEIPVEYVRSLQRSDESMPQEIRDLVAKCVAALASQDKAKRSEAVEQLVKLGRPIRKLLEAHMAVRTSNTDDIRMKQNVIPDILERIENPGD